MKMKKPGQSQNVDGEKMYRDLDPRRTLEEKKKARRNAMHSGHTHAPRPNTCFCCVASGPKSNPYDVGACRGGYDGLAMGW